MAQLLILVNVPELEPHIAHLRARHDPSAQRGLGAHITLVHANMPSEGLDPARLEIVGTAASCVAPFGYWISGVARFPDTLYLEVVPAAPFASLKDRLSPALMSAGRPANPQPLVPHVSVVRKSNADDSEVESELRAMLARHGPISCTCQEIVLLENSSGRWRPVQQFPLSGGTDSPWPTPC